MLRMQLRKYRWSRDYESAEEELHALLALRGIEVERHAAEEGETFECVAAKDTQLWCAEGMFTVHAAGKAFSMQPGDTLDLPNSTTYDLTARFGGCVWYQS
jgi:hypothetical protein